MKTPQLTEAKVLIFELDPHTDWFLKTSGPDFAKVPGSLKIETTFQSQRIQSTRIIHGPKIGGSWSFFTGLKPTGIPGVLYGDHFIGGKRSFVLFALSEGGKRLTVHYFNEIDIVPRLRVGFVKRYLKARV